MARGCLPILDVREVALLNLETRGENPRTRPEPIAIFATFRPEIELKPQRCGLYAELTVSLNETRRRLPSSRGVPRCESLKYGFGGIVA